MDKKELALIWMSAGNSYFTEATIRRIINFALGRFPYLIIMAPDEPAEHTYKALGYEEKIAKKKARLNANLLQNRTKRVVNSLDKKLQDRIKIVEWIDEIIPNQSYQKEYQQILKLYKSYDKFKIDALKTTLEVIKSKGFIKDYKKASKEAVYYLLKELAFVLASLEIYNAQRVIYVYHKSWNIYEKFINGEYDGKKREKFSFILTGIK